MTADWARIPYDVLDQHLHAASSTKSRSVNRIVYDITS